MAGGEGFGVPYDLSVHWVSGKGLIQYAGGDGRRPWLEALEEGGSPQVAGAADRLQRVTEPFVAPGLFREVFYAVIRDCVHLQHCQGGAERCVIQVSGEKVPLPCPFGSVSLFERPRLGAVLIAYRLVSFVGDAGFEHREVPDAHEAIAAADAVVQEGEGFAGHLAFDPERDFAEFDGERVFVHAVNAVGDDVADGFAPGFGGGFFFAGADAG